ncbi:hypothetical protein N9L68_05375 [bacterium]|nr:hypothetical protein [bacterium]
MAGIRSGICSMVADEELPGATQRFKSGMFKDMTYHEALFNLTANYVKLTSMKTYDGSSRDYLPNEQAYFVNWVQRNCVIDKGTKRTLELPHRHPRRSGRHRHVHAWGGCREVH